MKKILLIGLTLGLLAMLVFGDFPLWTLTRWLWIWFGIAIVALIFWGNAKRKMWLRGTKKAESYTWHPHPATPTPATRPAAQPATPTTVPPQNSPLKEKPMTTNQTPVNPRKAWGVTFIFLLIITTIFGSFIMENLVTVLLITVPMTVAILGAQNKIKNLGWIILIVVVVELLALAIGVFEPLYDNLANFGGELQCFSGLALVGWAIYAFRGSIARKLDIPEGTAQAMKNVAQEEVKKASNWLHK